MTYNKIVYNLFMVAALVWGSAAARGFSGYSQKTYLSPRSHGVNTAMEYTTWHQHAYKKHKVTNRSHFQAAPFYQKSQRAAELGKYFGIGNGKNSFKIGLLPPDAQAADLDKGLIIHDQGARADGLRGTVAFNPEQEVFGSRLDFFQDVNHPVAGLFFKASAPFVHVANTMGLKVTDGHATPAFGTKTFTLEDFFAGRVQVLAADDGTNLQDPLTKAKIAGRRTAQGIADIDLGLGYKYLDEEKRHAFISVEVTIPTGTKVRGEYLFDAAYGNGRHFGLGASLDAGLELWRSDKSTLRALWVARYKYLFEGTESRTLGVKGVPFGQYFLAGTTDPAGTGTAQTGKALFPLANVLTQGLTVKPGSMLDTSLDFAFNSNNFTIDVGYNLFWRDQETVHAKAAFSQNLAIAAGAHDTTGPLVVPAAVFLNNIGSLLDISTVKTPSLLSHKLFAGFGYSGTMYKHCRWSVGCGGSYEFATSNADIENYAVWLKGGLSI